MILDVPATPLIERAAVALKKMPEFKAPTWAAFARTGTSKQRPPVNPDWWHVRAAAILRKIYLLGPIGVSKLANHYGGRKNYGHAPEHFCPGATNHIRKILQQLDKAGFAKHVEKAGHKGRIATPKGISFLDKQAAELAKELNITIPKLSTVTELPIEKAPKAKKTTAKKESGAKTPSKPRVKKAPGKPAESVTPEDSTPMKDDDKKTESAEAVHQHNHSPENQSPKE